LATRLEAPFRAATGVAAAVRGAGFTMPDSSSRYCAGGITPPQDPQRLERGPVCM
jgi:hypothetical protein